MEIKGPLPLISEGKPSKVDEEISRLTARLAKAEKKNAELREALLECDCRMNGALSLVRMLEAAFPGTSYPEQQLTEQTQAKAHALLADEEE